MPGIIRRTLGTADKAHESTHGPPEKGWECFYENDGNDDEIVGGPSVPRPRRKRRKTPTSTTTDMMSLKELLMDEVKEEPNDNSNPTDLPQDLQGNEYGGDATTTRGQDDTGAVKPAATPSALSTLARILGYVTNMTSTISQVQNTVSELVSSVNNSLKQRDASLRNEEPWSRMDALAARFEAALERHESNRQSQVQDFQAQILKLQQEVQDRNTVIFELQQSQEEERKESQERFAEALQRLAQVLAQTGNSAATIPPTTHPGSSPSERGTNQEPRERSTAVGTIRSTWRRTTADDSSSVDTFSTPIGMSKNHESDDSPFSAGGSTSSNHAVSKRKRKITPGATLLGRGNTSLKDLVPHYPRSYG